MADRGNVATSVSESEEHPGPSPLSIFIRVNHPALGGTVPISTAMSRRPDLLTPCPVFIDHPVLGGTSRFQV